MKTHELKCHPHFFEALQREEKTFEIRRNDRNYQRGDILKLRKYDPAYGLVPGEAPLSRRVTYIMNDEDFPAIQSGFVIMGLAVIDEEVQAQARDKRCNEYLKMAGEPLPPRCAVHGKGVCSGRDARL